MIIKCECNYNIDLQRYEIVTYLEDGRSAATFVHLSRWNDPNWMSKMLSGLVMLHKRIEEQDE